MERSLNSIVTIESNVEVGAVKIGELAKLTGCSVQSIRYYEKEKLLPSMRRSNGNFRLYDLATVEQLKFIKHCRNLDLSLAEIRQLMDLNQQPGMQCDDVNNMVDTHVEQVALRIKELQHLQKQLKLLRDSCSKNRTVKECGILKNLSANQK
ncbi:MAG: Cd(II)/Pb(II)-responsive transcriptional regulator [Pseudomonadales bacterium]|nr:Cd(II)/Pb(II)-responsive transcriptional regulator [Pseudomonadales bacterium]